MFDTLRSASRRSLNHAEEQRTAPKSDEHILYAPNPNDTSKFASMLHERHTVSAEITHALLCNNDVAIFLFSEMIESRKDGDVSQDDLFCVSHDFLFVTNPLSKDIEKKREFFFFDDPGIKKQIAEFSSLLMSTK